MGSRRGGTRKHAYYSRPFLGPAQQQPPPLPTVIEAAAEQCCMTDMEFKEQVLMYMNRWLRLEDRVYELVPTINREGIPFGRVDSLQDNSVHFMMCLLRYEVTNRTNGVYLTRLIGVCHEAARISRITDPYVMFRAFISAFPMPQDVAHTTYARDSVLDQPVMKNPDKIIRRENCALLIEWLQSRERRAASVVPLQQPSENNEALAAWPSLLSAAKHAKPQHRGGAPPAVSSAEPPTLTMEQQLRGLTMDGTEGSNARLYEIGCFEISVQSAAEAIARDINVPARMELRLEGMRAVWEQFYSIVYDACVLGIMTETTEGLQTMMSAEDTALLQMIHSKLAITSGAKVELMILGHCLGANFDFKILVRELMFLTRRLKIGIPDTQCSIVGRVLYLLRTLDIDVLLQRAYGQPSNFSVYARPGYVSMFARRASSSASG